MRAVLTLVVLAAFGCSEVNRDACANNPAVCPAGTFCQVNAAKGSSKCVALDDAGQGMDAAAPDAALPADSTVPRDAGAEGAADAGIDAPLAIDAKPAAPDLPPPSDSPPPDGPPSCTNLCAVGTSKCGSGGTQACLTMPNGCTAYAPEVACQSPRSCVQGASSATCECPAGCTVGEERCSGAAIQKCATRNSCSVWEATTTCETPKTCKLDGSTLACACPAATHMECSGAVCGLRVWTFESGSLDGATVDPQSEYFNVVLSQPLRVERAPGGSRAMGASLLTGPGQGGSQFARFDFIIPLCAQSQTATVYQKNFTAKVFVQTDRPPSATENVEVSLSPHIPPLKPAPFGTWFNYQGNFSTTGYPVSLYSGVKELRFSFMLRVESPWTLTIWIDDVRIDD